MVAVEVERSVLPQDQPLELLQPLRRVDAELVAKHPLEALERLERLGMPAAAVEGEHQLASQPLTERVPANERIELGHELSVEAERELRVDALLEADEALLLEPRLLEPGERLLELGERRAAPQPQCAAQRGGGLLRAAGRERFASRRMEALEGAQVERMAVEREAVPGRTGLDQPLRHVLAEQRDGDLHHLGCARRHVLAPEVVDDPGRRDDAIRVQQEQRQQRLLLAARQVDGACVVRCLERAQNPELHVPPDVRRRFRGADRSRRTLCRSVATSSAMRIPADRGCATAALPAANRAAISFGPAIQRRIDDNENESEEP